MFALAVIHQHVPYSPSFLHVKQPLFSNCPISKVTFDNDDNDCLCWWGFHQMTQPPIFDKPN